MVAIIFTHQIAGGVVDLPRTKSEVSIPVYYPKDLVGCGSDTHHFNSGSASFNSRSQCAPPTSVMTRSVSGLTVTDPQATAWGGPANDRYTSTFAGSENLLYNTLHAYLRAALVSAQTGANFQFDTAPSAAAISGMQAFTRRGNVWRSTDGATNPQEVMTVQVARLVPQFDQCGLEIGVKGVSSIQLTSFDANCVPRLMGQVSLSVAIHTGPILDAPWDVANLAPAPIIATETGILMTTAGGVNAVQANYAPLPFTVTFPNVL